MTAPPPADSDPVTIARRCWEELQQERMRCGMSLRKLADELRQQYPSEAPAHTTLKDWFATRKSLPNKPLFLALVRVLRLDEQHWGYRWERWHRARQIRPAVLELRDSAYTTENDDDRLVLAPIGTESNTPVLLDQAALASTGDAGSLGLTPPTWRRPLPRSMTVIAGAAMVALAMLAVAVSQAGSSPAGHSGMAQPAPSDAPDLAAGRNLAVQPNSPRTLLSPANPAQLSPPISSATAANFAAHVDFHRDSNLFRLYDDRRDGRSAILELKIDGAVAEPWYNSKGKTDATHPAKEVPRPPVGPDASIEFRVCVGEYGDPVPEQTCGAWITDPG
jgi:hypothetical protein